MLSPRFVMRTLLLCVSCLAFAAQGSAEVVDSSANGFAVRNVAQIAAHPSRVYNAAVDLISRWWNPAHSFSKNAANLSGGTQFEWTYAVGGYMPGGLAAIAPAVDAVLGDQLNRLKRFVESGRPE